MYILQLYAQDAILCQIWYAGGNTAGVTARKGEWI